MKQILNGWHNIYTFTKSLTEKSIYQRRGSMPCCIVRPASVGASLSEPFAGWTDTTSALGGQIYFGGLGIYKYMVGNPNLVLDEVAVDLCINHILIATCHCSHFPEKLHVYNHSSSTQNPLTVKRFMTAINKFNKYYPYDK